MLQLWILTIISCVAEFGASERQKDPGIFLSG
ncbi:unnamed protein product, partial [Strongylus vulgaris]